MQTRILKAWIDEIGESGEWDAGDHAWWVRHRVDDAVESTIELINKHLFEKDQIVIVPEEKYLKCTCQFKKTMEDGKYGYREVLVHTSYCLEHHHDKPWTIEEHIESCPECQMHKRYESDNMQC